MSARQHRRPEFPHAQADGRAGQHRALAQPRRPSRHHLHHRSEIIEYASNCAGPIVHKAGDVVAETPEISHWWKNLGDKTVVLLSADLLHDPNDHNM
jgi:hypothetical protein